MAGQGKEKGFIFVFVYNPVSKTTPSIKNSLDQFSAVQIGDLSFHGSPHEGVVKTLFLSFQTVL